MRERGYVFAGELREGDCVGWFASPMRVASTSLDCGSVSLVLVGSRGDFVTVERWYREPVLRIEEKKRPPQESDGRRSHHGRVGRDEQ